MNATGASFASDPSPRAVDQHREAGFRVCDVGGFPFVGIGSGQLVLQCIMTVSDAYWEWHAEQEQQGLLTHSVQACPQKQGLRVAA